MYKKSFRNFSTNIMTILSLTKQLIRIPSVTSNQDACKQVLDVIVGIFGEISDIYIERFEHAWVHSLIIKNFDGKWADICFNAHVDVVPPQDESQRTSYEQDGMLYARGAGDMKDGVALISLLMRELMTNPPQPSFKKGGCLRPPFVKGD